jgi:hypothetical protein
LSYLELIGFLKLVGIFVFAVVTLLRFDGRVDPLFLHLGSRQIEVGIRLLEGQRCKTVVRRMVIHVDKKRFKPLVPTNMIWGVIFQSNVVKKNQNHVGAILV